MVASPTLVKRRDIACLRGLLLIAFGGILFEAGAVAAGSTALALLIGHGLTTLLLLSSKRLSDVTEFEGRALLKDDLRERINGIVGEGKVASVLFTEFVVQ